MFHELCALVLAVGGLASGACAQGSQALKEFEYDRNAPLNVREAKLERRGDIAIHDISYDSPKGGRVTAYLVVPPGRGPFAAVIWGHWYWGNSPQRNRTEFLDEAVALAASGVVSLLIDGPLARPGYTEPKDPLDGQLCTDRIQSIVDIRRAADLLLGRKDVDRKRLAYVGHSYHATTGGYLSGIDRRFKAFVLMAGNLADEADLRSEEYRQFRQRAGPEKFDAFLAKWGWLDPGKFVSHAAPAVIFMQFASQENYMTAARAREYAAYVSEPKRFALYDAPHALNAEARRDRLGFLAEQLSLTPLPRKVIDRIPDLYQPPEPKR